MKQLLGGLVVAGKFSLLWVLHPYIAIAITGVVMAVVVMELLSRGTSWLVK